jgi:hypothetical protein
MQPLCFPNNVACVMQIDEFESATGHRICATVRVPRPPPFLHLAPLCVPVTHVLAFTGPRFLHLFDTPVATAAVTPTVGTDDVRSPQAADDRPSTTHAHRPCHHSGSHCDASAMERSPGCQQWRSANEAMGGLSSSACMHSDIALSRYGAEQWHRLASRSTDIRSLYALLPIGCPQSFGHPARALR